MLFVNTARGFKPVCSQPEFSNIDSTFVVPSTNLGKAVCGELEDLQRYEFRYTCNGAKFAFDAFIIGVDADGAVLKLTGEVLDVTPISEEFRKQYIEAQEC